MQKPVAAMKSLRRYPESLAGDLEFDEGGQYELKLAIKKDQEGTLTLAADKNFEQGLKLSFSTGSHASLTLDRGNVGADVNVDYGTTRSLALPKNRELKLRIFVDHSLLTGAFQFL